MRLLIVGTLAGQLTTATKLAMDRGATVTHAADIAQALAVLRAGRGADLLMVDVAVAIRELENTMHRAVLIAIGAEIGPEAILAPDGVRLDQQRGAPPVAHAALAAEQVSRAFVGRTVAEVERDLILETLKHCLGNRTHAANVLGISIRTLRNKLNEYAADGVPVPPPGGGEPRAAA
jgi:transcriptional regulator with PAS, ATPase and Fis domain